MMLCDSAIALFLSVMRVLNNEHFVADDSAKIDQVARRLVQQHEQGFIERLMPACAKLAVEDDMPGKLFALIEELLITLVLFSEGLEGAKLHALLKAVMDLVIVPVISERDLANILNSINLLRLFSLLKEPSESAQSRPIMEKLGELLVQSQTVIAEDYRDSSEDQKDWIKVVCAGLGTLLLAQDTPGGPHLAALLESFLRNPAFF